MIVEDENTVSTTGKTNLHLCRNADSHTFPLIPCEGVQTSFLVHDLHPVRQLAEMSFKNVDSLLSLVDFNQTSLLISLAAIAFNPTAWNIVARNGTCFLTPSSEGFSNPKYHLRICKQDNNASVWG